MDYSMFTSDSCSANLSALQQVPSLPCFCHLVQLAVNEGVMPAPSDVADIAKFREMDMEGLLQAQLRHNNLSTKSLLIECSRLVAFFKRSQLNKKLAERPGLVKVATKDMQRVQPAAAVVAIQRLEDCWRHIEEQPANELEVVRETRGLIRDAFLNKVIMRLTPDAFVAMMLDPRYKLKGVERLRIVREFRAKHDLLNHLPLINQLRAWAFNETYVEPPEIADLDCATDGSPDGSCLSMESLPKWQCIPAVHISNLEDSVNEEVERYLKLDRHGDAFEDWWCKAEREGYRYLPKAARVSRHLLLATSSCESLFSCCKNELGLLRSSLGTEALEATMIVKTTQSLL
ncbi:hypothetical protein FOL47_001940 [Perkinsus chesapeaki]|uniref:Uncharacterized protein n=1 Tax=Perkinsus chesapeaki TaxID=330153 RepID=A0A7J6KSI7_PERCH|nr:hypothetical protein FOL47_001940 [Perkinsus chesapeaki]